MQSFDDTIDMMAAQRIVDDSVTSNTLVVRDGQMATLTFLAMIVWPLPDLYWLATVSLRQLLPAKILSQREFAELCAKHAATLYYAGHIDFFECVGIHSINNALKWFQPGASSWSPTSVEVAWRERRGRGYARRSAESS